MGRQKLKSVPRVATPWWTRPWLLALLLFAMAAAAYLPALRAGFIWDDDDYVTENLTLRSADGLREIWFKPGATYQYYPLIHTTFWTEYHLWQLKPIGFHAVNIALHTLAAVLLWRVLLRIQGMDTPQSTTRSTDRINNQLTAISWCWFAAAIWALHPVCVESVAWVTERKNVLSAVFYFAAALTYLRSSAFRAPRSAFPPSSARPSQSPVSCLLSPGYYFALLLFACALLSKTVTCSLPAALLLVLWWKHGRLTARGVLPTLPFFAIGIASGLFTAWVEKHHVGAVGADWTLTFWERCLIAGRALWFYAAKIIWPVNLTFIYPRWPISTAVWWQWIFPSAAVAVVLVLWFLRNRIGRGPLVAVLFFAGTLVPALGFVNVYPMRYSFVADHFQYLASVGLIALASAAFSRWSSRFSVFPDRLKLAILLTLAALTWRQTHIYSNLETLWRDTIAKNPACWMAHNNLGEVLRAQGKPDEADHCYKAALQIKPAYAEALNNSGYLLFDQQRFDEAEALYRKAIEADPDFAPAWSNLGAVLISLQREDDAMVALRRALELDGNSADALSNLAVALTVKKQYADAITLCETVIRSHPDHADIHINLGNIYMAMGRANDAIAQFAEAARLDPLNTKARSDLAGALAARGDNARAIQQYSQAVLLSPGDATLHYNLGVLLAASHRTPEAVQHFQEAIKLKPDYAEANNNLGVVLTLAGEINEALKHFETAIKSRPDYAEAHNNLGYALIKLGRPNDAVLQLREALRINPDYKQAKDQLRSLEQTGAATP
jgi:protein O-mannosyl-transferase